jgi:hypothetical protein
MCLVYQDPTLVSCESLNNDIKFQLSLSIFSQIKSKVFNADINCNTYTRGPKNYFEFLTK